MQTASVPAEQLVGQTVGKYRLEQLLGYGHVNAVYLAHHFEQNHQVMVTAFLIPEHFSVQARERFLTRFSQEASTLIKLKHSCLLPVYDFGMQPGYPYLVTPMTSGRSLVKVLQEQGRCNPAQTMKILKYVASGLDYAHSNGVVHGTLKPANILLEQGVGVQVSGLGLMCMLALRGIEPSDDPRAHLLSIAGTFLGSPEYMAPEVLQGSPVDACSDVYSLGVILFELLSGQLPYASSDPFELTRLHMERPVPSLQNLCSDVPAALDLVVQRALERDPAQRFQYPEKLASAFERVLNVIQAATTVPLPAQAQQSPVNALIQDATLLPTVNWFAEDGYATEKWEATPSGLSGQMPHMGQDATHASPGFPPGQGGETGGWQIRPPIVTGRLPSVKTVAVPQNVVTTGEMGAASPAARNQDDSVDPFLLWSTGSLASGANKAPGTFNAQNEQPAQKTKSKKRHSSNKEGQNATTPNKSRRRAVAMIASGGVLAAGVLAAGGVALMYRNIPGMQMSGGSMSMSTNNNSYPQMQGKNGNKQNTGAGNGNGQNTNNKMNQPPKQQKQMGQTGTSVASTARFPVNTAKTFTTPKDKKPALLIHLANGSFVAYESTCTHEAGSIYYDAASKKMVCAKHGAVFDPAKAAQILKGPADVPLPMVPIRVNNDGTITVAG